MQATRTVTPAIFAQMQAAPTNDKAWEIFVDTLEHGDEPQFIGGFDSCTWTDTHVIFHDRGVFGRGHLDIKVKSE